MEVCFYFKNIPPSPRLFVIVRDPLRVTTAIFCILQWLYMTNTLFFALLQNTFIEYHKVPYKYKSFLFYKEEYDIDPSIFQPSSEII